MYRYVFIACIASMWCGVSWPHRPGSPPTHPHPTPERREQFDYILDVTSFKSKAPWAADLFKDVPPKVKAAFTRCAARRVAAACRGCGGKPGVRRYKLIRAVV